ncbi:hypothetical protein BRCON_2197 [Candidatus Sumerlaea chitinivorans]|uniref:Uncharacterized protein n=1 Tax=Sumerlaea chitinivorans TaxID=2250252 RepID=A0A2Z4Y6Y3_SUMC1|nr:hypothetical protein BRCON_2197 [Candidatus Sumerlaea chitinivorans]
MPEEPKFSLEARISFLPFKQKAAWNVFALVGNSIQRERTHEATLHFPVSSHADTFGVT